MSDKTEINLLDDEYMTPQQRAELRKTMTELPLWAESAQPATRGVIKPETTIDAAKVQTDVEAVAGALTAKYVRMSDTELHRALNGTTGMESEE